MLYILVHRIVKDRGIESILRLKAATGPLHQDVFLFSLLEGRYRPLPMHLKDVLVVEDSMGELLHKDIATDELRNALGQDVKPQYLVDTGPLGRILLQDVIQHLPQAI